MSHRALLGHREILQLCVCVCVCVCVYMHACMIGRETKKKQGEEEGRREKGEGYRDMIHTILSFSSLKVGLSFSWC